MDGGAWWAAVLGVAESQTQLSDFTFTFYFHALEKEMAALCSILAWEIAWLQEATDLQSIGSQKSWTRLSDWKTVTTNQAICESRFACVIRISDD